MTLAASLSEAAAVTKYVGLMLNADSIKRLHDWWVQATSQPLLPAKPPNAHVTLLYDPTPDQIAGFEIGERISVRVIGWASSDRIQAVVVSGVDVPAGRVAHVTLATAPGVKAQHASELIKAGYTRVSGPTLNGTVNVMRARPR